MSKTTIQTSETTARAETTSYFEQANITQDGSLEDIERATSYIHFIDHLHWDDVPTIDRGWYGDIQEYMLNHFDNIGQDVQFEKFFEPQWVDTKGIK